MFNQLSHPGAPKPAYFRFMIFPHFLCIFLTIPLDSIFWHLFSAVTPKLNYTASLELQCDHMPMRYHYPGYATAISKRDLLFTHLSCFSFYITYIDDYATHLVIFLSQKSVSSIKALSFIFYHSFTHQSLLIHKVDPVHLY